MSFMLGMRFGEWNLAPWPSQIYRCWENFCETLVGKGGKADSVDSNSDLWGGDLVQWYWPAAGG
jgi:hypothetical protein